MPVTMLEIARRVNVSQATVSRVLSGKPSQFISESTRAKVISAAVELGYQMNRAARSLATGKTQVIGLWVRNPDRPYYARIIRTLHDLMQRDGYEMNLSAFVQQPEPPEGVPEMPPHRPIVAGWPVDGIIAADCAQAAREHLRHEFASAGEGREPARVTPLVGVSSDYPADADFIGCDHEAGCAEAVRHLIESGRTRIAHLTANGAIGPVRAARMRVYERAVAGAGLRREILTATEETRSAARAAVIERFRGASPPDALFCINDDLAIGALRGARDAGLRVPEDVAIVGVDGTEDTAYTDPPLTTVVQPVEEMCRLAWETLRARMTDADAPARQVLLPARLVVRASTQRG